MAIGAGEHEWVVLQHLHMQVACIERQRDEPHVNIALLHATKEFGGAHLEEHKLHKRPAGLELLSESRQQVRPHGRDGRKPKAPLHLASHHRRVEQKLIHKAQDLIRP